MNGAATWRRFGWVLFAAQLTALFAYAVHVDRKAARATANADIGRDGVRFGLPEKKRREHFAEMMRGEKENRETAEKMKELLIWNRNHDSYFHQHEWSRILWWSHRLGLKEWQGWLILDEGLRNHWTPPPGTPVLVDEAPLAPTTRPLDKRPVMIPAPPPLVPAAGVAVVPPKNAPAIKPPTPITPATPPPAPLVKPGPTAPPKSTAAPMRPVPEHVQ